MTSDFFDLVYNDRKVMAPFDSSRGFTMLDMEPLDAPKLLPAGSTESRRDFHFSRFTFRIGG